MTWAERTLKKWAEATNTLDDSRRMNLALVDWCCQTQWHVFWTQTFRTPHSAWGTRSRWLSCLAEHRWGSILSKVVYSIEPHKNTRSHHVHALLSMKSGPRLRNYASPFDVWRSDWRFVKEWCWHTMGKALLLPVTNNDAVPYVLKYITKKARDVTWMQVTPTPATPEAMWGVLSGEHLLNPGTC